MGLGLGLFLFIYYFLADRRIRKVLTGVLARVLALMLVLYLTRQTTILRVHHINYIHLPSLHDHDMEFPLIISLTAAGLTQSVRLLTAEREVVGSIPGAGPILRVLK